MVLRRARQILGSDDQAKEVLQEIFLGLVDRPDKFEGRSAITTFLYAATTNMCLNRMRDTKNRTRLLEHWVVPAAADAAIAPHADAVIELRRVLDRLPPEEAAAAIYYYLDGMSHDEIAKVQGCSRRQVGYLLERMHGRMQAAEAEAS